MKEAIQIILGIIGGLLAIVSVPVAALYFLVVSQSVPSEPTPQVVSRQTPAPKPPTAAGIVTLVNDEREKRGIAPLKVHPKLNESAQAKANDLYTNEYFEHINPETGKIGTYYVFDLTGYELCRVSVSENLAQGHLSAPETVEDWLESRSHRETMLNPKFELTGVAVVKDYRPGGGYIAVQHFCDVE